MGTIARSIEDQTEKAKNAPQPAGGTFSLLAPAELQSSRRKCWPFCHLSRRGVGRDNRAGDLERDAVNSY